MQDGKGSPMKTKITESFINLSLQKKTTKIPVRHLCEHIGISRTTFYKYFKDTYEIIESVFMQDVFQPMETLFESHITPKLIIQGWYMNFYRHKDFFILAMKEDGQNSLFFTITNALTEYNKNLYASILAGDDLEYYSYKYAAIQAMLMRKWLQDGMKISPDKMTEYFYNDMLNGHFE